jgi:hypothetical protein
MAETEDAIISRLESIGESVVRARLPSGDFGDVPSHPYRRVTEDWLAAKASARAEADSAKQDAREAESLSIAKEANDIARSASKWALYAAIIATVAIIVATKDALFSLIFGNP